MRAAAVCMTEVYTIDQLTKLRADFPKNSWNRTWRKKEPFRKCKSAI